MVTVLVTGATGQVGTELARLRWPDGWEVVALGRDRLDLADPASIASVMGERLWDAVVNAGAYTAVDRAQVEQAAAWAVNASGPAALGQACRDASIPLVQVSTDYVFPGYRAGEWEVDDPIAPLGVYGASKAGGELAVRASGARHAIVRTAWVVSAHGSNFVKTMLRLAERGSVRVVADQEGSPTSAADLARALATVTQRLVTDPAMSSGTYQFSNAGRTNWAEFADEIFRQSSARGGHSADVEAIATRDYPTAARRPANSLLSHTAIRDAFGIEPRPWQAALSDIMDELIGAPQ